MQTFSVIKSCLTRSFIKWTYHQLYNFLLFKHWCHLNCLLFPHNAVMNNILIAELWSTSVILWIKFLKSSLLIYFCQLFLTAFIQQSLSPRPITFDKHFGVAILIQASFSLAPCLSWLNLLWAVYISEGHSTNQRGRKNFFSALLFPVTALFFLQNPKSLMLSSLPHLAD